MIAKILQKRYQIQRQLRKNPGRQTWLARDLTTQKLVVIKLLTFNSGLEWQDWKLFTREARILQELDHPAIPVYLDYFELNLPELKGFALVQTYIPAKSLAEYLQAERRSRMQGCPFILLGLLVMRSNFITIFRL